MKASYKRPFAKFIKKAHKTLALAIEDAVDDICSDPNVGEANVGDLFGIWVFKFRFNKQEYLIAYTPPLEDVPLEFIVINFYQVGSHENFYDELKRYLKSREK
jgi:hypothetical protein